MDSSNKTLIIIILVIILTWAGSAALTILMIDNWSDRGTFGDLFGGINSLFSGLALAGLLYTIISSKDDIDRQREEIELNRKELIKSRKTQEKSERALEEQVNQMRISIKISGLKTLIDYHSSILLKKNITQEKRDLATQKRKELIREIDILINRLTEDDID